MVNIGIIGYGFMGQKHAKEIKKFKDFNLLGIYDIRNWKNDLDKENGKKYIFKLCRNAG